MKPRTFAVAICLLPTVGAALAQGPFRSAPAELVELSSSRVGELVPDLQFLDIDEDARRLSDAVGENGLVEAIRSVRCPVSRRYGARLARLEKELADRGVGLLFVNASSQDSVSAIREEIASFGFTSDYVHEPTGTGIASALRTTTTSEVFLLDAARTLRYRGAIDDQYGIGYSKAEPTKTYLADAVDDLLAGRALRVEATTAPGCVLGLSSDPPPGPRAITYHNRISRIVQRNCEACHRAGGAGPFPLDAYEQTKGFSAMIAYVVENGVMPPWFANPAHGMWANDRSLSSRDREALLSWISSGAPEGDPDDAPLARRYAGGWSIGEPDVIFEIPEAVDVPREGVVDYQYVYVKTDLPEDRWVQKMEVLPSAPQVTHHVLVFLEEPGRKGADDKSRKRGEPIFQGGLGGYFVSTVPGQQPTIYPDGTAKLLPKGAWLKFQIHYTPNGEPAVDQTRLGLVFADEPPRYEMETSAAFDVRFEFPHGAANHEVVGTYAVKKDIMLTMFFPHMHQRGTAFRYELVYPDGREETILDVPGYDFNWQLLYELGEPMRVPKGSVLRSTGWFDNSPSNPANPDPSVPVRFGEQTFEEMMIGYFDWYDANRGAADTPPEP